MLDVYVPEKKAAGPMPVLVFFYGGGWTSGHRQDYAFAGHALAARGFVTVVPDYRLAPQHPYPDFVQDAATAVRWAHDHAAQYGGDPNRIVLAGHSAGGYLAIMLAMDDDFLRAAGVDFSLIKGAAGLSGPYDFYPFDVDSSRLAFGLYPDPKATQPISYAARPHRPPVLLIQGQKDRLVGVHNAVNLDRALRQAGNASTLHLYPSLSHPDTVLALSIPFRGKAPILAETADFLHAQAGR
jgi:acetyl esterase/lipase